MDGLNENENQNEHGNELAGDEGMERKAAATALACLPGMTPARLRRVLEQWPDPRAAAQAVSAGRAAETLRGPEERKGQLTRTWASSLDVTRAASTLARRGTEVCVIGDDSYPMDVGLPGVPAVLFLEGQGSGAFARARVAIVGTRAATPHGLADAHELGAHLARNGVTVVSGLAIGIDAAAHRGALTIGHDEESRNGEEDHAEGNAGNGNGGGCNPGHVVGVVATGLDVVYPRRHIALFEEVRRRGLIVGENAFGTQPEPARFPVRNRIIAALADVVVVIEATMKGGARITAEWAMHYGRPLFALPGSRRNVAAEGCNALIADGAQPLLDWDDVLVAVGMTPGSRRTADEPANWLDASEHRVLHACGGEPATADQLSARTGMDPGEIAVAVAALKHAGLLTQSRGFLWPA